MNFKPTIAKSIVSILGGIAIVFLSLEIFARPGRCGPDGGGYIICVDYAPSPWPLILGILSLVLIYAVWSLLTEE